ncbi:MAG: hypothetical protein IPI23_00830 [Bacteroidetes bacterium]|nr:hypothetical protein [Bacteroidota bacterium]
MDEEKALLEVIQNAIFRSKDLLTVELTQFFKANPPDSILDMKEGITKDRMVKDIIDKILVKTKIPDASELIKNMLIDPQYAEFTEEDLSNVEFLAWFKKRD